MPLPLFSLFRLALVLQLVRIAVTPVGAQVGLIQAPSCLPSEMVNWNWTCNSLKQTPCQTAAHLGAACNNGQFTIPPIAPMEHYTGPTGGGTKCSCNSVFYSLLSACAGCQSGKWIPYGQWNANCTSVDQLSTFPQEIPNDTLVPAWAFVGVSDTLPWDNVSACSVGRSPESSGTFRPPFAPRFGAIRRDAAHIGMLIGLVVGCTLLVIGVAVWFFSHRYRGRFSPAFRLKPFSKQNLTVEHESAYSVAAWTPEPDKRFYNPSDPSTYPYFGAASSRAAESSTATHSLARTPDPTTPGSTNYHPTYSGFPEI